MKKMLYFSIVFFLFTFFTNCEKEGNPPLLQPDNPHNENPDTTTNPNYEDATIGAGFRFSTYGPEYNPGANYWASVGEQMSEKFENAKPQGIWIIGSLYAEGVYLSFPVEGNHQFIWGANTDENEATFDIFDERGVEIWLQVEPGNADVVELIDLILTQYSHHECIIGVGVDVEWYKSVSLPEGQAVTDAEAELWLATAKQYNPKYKLFLKHWLIEKMPQNFRNDMVFIDDSQELTSLTAMTNEFKTWGETFSEAEVGFQIGYEADKTWWGNYTDPASVIGNKLIEEIPNTTGIFWVDFTVLEVFPPSKEK